MVFCFFVFFLFLHFFILLLSLYGFSFVFELESFFYFSVPFSFLFMVDWMSLFFSSFVVLISSIIILYSGYYMAGDFFLSRFIFILVIFVISMVFLIFGGNFFMIMIGWDGLGLVSFCLIIYYSSSDSAVSGILTIIMNRLGDGLIILSVFFFGILGGFYVDLVYFSNFGLFLLLFSFFTSSAQFPFSSWLPAAMSAPTPISSLVHSSTLVTAGVYLSIRFSFIFVNFCMSTFLMLFSVLTLFVGGILALVEIDFSKIVAMSTLSQLGLMFFMISIGFFKLSFFHMISHAFFKSLLFMCTGSVILSGSQDSRLSGGFLFSSPFVYSVMLVSLFSLMSVPFSVGFYSKDLILDSLFSSNFALFYYFIFVVGGLITVLYSIRIMLNVFFWSYSGGSVFSNGFSFYMIFSFLFGVFLTLFWGKLVYYFIFMEDFVLLSFPLSMLGFSLILLGFFISISSFFLGYFYIFLSWFKSFLSSFYFFDFFYKFDQVWIESVYMNNIFILIGGGSRFLDFDSSIIWISFLFVWFLGFSFISLTI